MSRDFDPVANDLHVGWEHIEYFYLIMLPLFCRVFRPCAWGFRNFVVYMVISE